MRLFTLFLFIFMALPNASNSQGLADYKWENRIILLIDAEGESFKEQLTVLKKHKAALEERDIIVLRYSDNKVLDINGAKSTINPESIPAKNFTGLLLLGKDGGVKLKKKFVVQPDEIFDLIDGMPMRKSEMRNGN